MVVGWSAGRLGRGGVGKKKGGSGWKKREGGDYEWVERLRRVRSDI
jgi:hypothetical protein